MTPTTTTPRPDLTLPLSCGHLTTRTDFSPGYCGGSGYATMTNGAHICYPCADDRERDHLRTARTAMAYLASDKATLTTWTGGRLATVTQITRQPVTTSVDTLYRFRATDCHGAHWCGTSPGPGMYARLRRCKTPK